MFRRSCIIFREHSTSGLKPIASVKLFIRKVPQSELGGSTVHVSFV
jgi:hypothetical protein